MTKASLFNLIIYTSDSRRTYYFRQMAHALIEQFPCRLLFIETILDDKKKELEIVPTSPLEEKSTCEEITIRVPAAMRERIPFIVLPHLVTDMPIYLLWGQSPAEDQEILRPLQKIANRLIFDSQCHQDFPSFCNSLKELVNSSEREAIDMNWAWICGWRDLLATLCTNPEERDLIRSSSKVEIQFNGRRTEAIAHTSIQSIYLQGWLANCLDWSFQNLKVEEEKANLHYQDKEGKKITLSLLPKEDTNADPGAILSLKTATKEGHELNLLRDPKLPRAMIHLSSPTFCNMPFTLPLPDSKRGFPFMKEIFYQKSSPHYPLMLQSVAQVPWKEWLL